MALARRHHHSRLLERLHAVHEARLAEARGALLLACEREQRSHDGVERAAAGTAAALADWQQQLGAPGFAPEFERALGGRLIRSVAEQDEMQEVLLQSTLEREARESEWQVSHGRLKQAARLRDDSRRADAKDREARALDAAADRATQRWRRG